MCWIFFRRILNLFFFFLFLPSTLSFLKLGLLPLRGLRQLPNRPNGRAGPGVMPVCFLLLPQFYHAPTLKCFSPCLATKNSYLLLLLVSVNQRLKYEIFELIESSHNIFIDYDIAMDLHCMHGAYLLKDHIAHNPLKQ